jgi:hypothetical protein
MSVHFPLRAFPFLLLGVGTWVAGSCGYEDIPTPSEGTLQVAVLTSGTGVDENGYTVIVNNTEADEIEVVDTIYLERLDTGLYEVALGGLQENCETLTGTNPQTITVLPGDTVGVTFNVTCETPPPPPPPDGPPQP